jgi:Fe-S oxidoreductase
MPIHSLDFALWEQALLAVLVALSVAIFARDLSARLAKVRAGRSDRPRTGAVGLRLRRVFDEVVLQKKVIGPRPVVGTLHAVVFFGFVLFGLETLDHFLKGFGVPFLAPVLGPALPAFKAFLAVVAAAVAVAMAGLAFRRFAMRRISPDPKSWTSALVAFFIIGLMLTYLNAYGAEPLLPKANWWAHAAIILVFPHVILRSKHFHLLLAPVDIWFKTERVGDYLAMDLSEEALGADGATLGLETMRDAPWKMRMDFLTCVECKRCTEQCPAHGAGQELDPRGFVLAGRHTLLELAADAPVIGNVISQAALGQCTSCGACESICPVGIEHLQVLMGAKRAQALSSGQGMVATKFLQSMERYGNPFAAPASAREKLVDELDIPGYEKGSTEWLLWLGCVWGYNADAKAPAAAMVKVLKQAGVSFGVLAEEVCCGHLNRRQGEEMQFQTFARQNLDTLRERGVEKIVTPCPHCFHTLRREYPTLEASFAPKVVHHSELLVQLLMKGDIRLERDGAAPPPMTFHDPCYLGRYEGVFDEPRSVLAAAGLTLTEMPRRRERSYCCGGGSAGFAREQEVAVRVDQRRKEEIVATGAKLLVTACPECKMMLDSAVEETRDLAEVVAARLAPAASAPT